MIGLLCFSSSNILLGMGFNQITRDEIPVHLYLLLVMRLSNIWYTLYSTVLLKIGYKILPILLQGMRFIFNILGLRFVHICYSTADDLFFYKGDNPFLLLWLVFIHYVTGDDIHPFQLLLIVSSITVIRDEIPLLGVTFISKYCWYSSIYLLGNGMWFIHLCYWGWYSSISVTVDWIIHYCYKGWDSSITATGDWFNHLCY